MKYILAGIRTLFFFAFTLIMVIALYISYYLLSIFGRQFSVRINHKLTMVIGWMLRFVLGVRVKTYNKEKMPKEGGFLMVSNHLGYIETTGILKASPMAFVAKEDIVKWPFIGAVAKATGTVFVNRDKGGMSETYINKTAEVLDNHINVWFSPEKTTTDGTWLRPFSSALFVAANRTKRPVVPAIFVIKKLNGKPVPKERRVELAWALTDEGKNTPFFIHFLHFMSFWWVDVEMHIMDPIIPDYDDSEIDERRKFSNHLHELMADELEKHEPEFDRERKTLNREA
ncbi:MAG: lysophospholipid acyltransferase family protein [Candidatus Marinimicrobia bacterium]|nr:lysophospholipid acyltransferase family protein [Candidatus Neomarinimicrobiota bacterium]